ncbi:MAG: hypothetical protein M0Z28_14230 [Rhodospirillales bacterium]|nr:hypothetical protein [Rhodospirillales bacterium]
MTKSTFSCCTSRFLLHQPLHLADADRGIGLRVGDDARDLAPGDAVARIQRRQRQIDAELDGFGRGAARSAGVLEAQAELERHVRRPRSQGQRRRTGQCRRCGQQAAAVERRGGCVSP